MKDELNHSYNGRVITYKLQSVAIHFNHTQYRNCLVIISFFRIFDIC